MSKKYTVTLTEKQLRAISDAADLLQRVQLGQWTEIQDNLPLDYKNIDWYGFHKDFDEIGRILSKHMVDGINGINISLGVGNENLPESNSILYDIYKSINHKLAMDKLIDEGKIKNENVSRNELPIFIQYDEVRAWSNEPLPKIERIEE